MSEPLFGKRERLYAEARRLEAEKAAEAANQEKENLAANREHLSVAPPPEPLVPTPPRRPPVTVPPAQKPSPAAWRATASTSLELGGIAMVSVGGFLISPWLGCILLGVLLIVLGVAIGYGA
jgi:hypothetical protein